MKILGNKSGFSMVEILVGVSVFTIAAVTASSLLVSIVRAEKKSGIQMAVYEDARIIMAQLAAEIRGGTIDFEEYYSVCVIQNPGVCGQEDQAEEGEVYFGINYGAYGARFFNPGQTIVDMAIPENPRDLGLECAFGPMDSPNNYTTGDGIDNCAIIYSLSSDLNTGQNPFLGSSMEPEDANAFCDSDRGVLGEEEDCDLKMGVTVDKLFLINSTGTKKTVLGRKRVTNDGDFAIGKVVMNGIDLDSNGIIDVFSCDNANFYCEGDEVLLAPLLPQLGGDIEAQAIITANEITVPVMSDLDLAFEDQIDFEDESPLREIDFIPITPLRTTVVDLKFIINPVEDPYKAFEEFSTASHPSVTIVATFDLSSEAKITHPGNFQPFKIQMMVSAGLSSGLFSYPPLIEIRDNTGTDASWVHTVLNGKVDPTSV